jgi:hypothetical protein
MSASDHLHALPRRSISVRFTPVSGIESRSQALPSRAITGREQMQQMDAGWQEDNRGPSFARHPAACGTQHHLRMGNAGRNVDPVHL